MDAPTAEKVSGTDLTIYENAEHDESSAQGVSQMRSERAAAARRKKKRKSPTPRAKQATDPTPKQEEVKEFILTWTPKRFPTNEVWVAIAPRVRELVTQVQPGGTNLARKYLRCMTDHLALQHAKGNRLDDLKSLFSDLAIASSFGPTSALGLSAASRSTAITYSLRFRERLLPQVYAKNPHLRVPRPPLATPYTEKELRHLLVWARSAKQEVASRVLAVLALGVGCGLDGYELGRVRGSDLYRTPWGLILRAPGIPDWNGRLPRWVPVIASFEDDIARLAREVGAEAIVDLKPKGVAAYKTHLSNIQPTAPNLVKINGAKSRMTWTKLIIEGEASFIACRIAGVSVASDKVLSTISKGLELPMEKYVKQLRCSATPFDPTPFLHLPQWSETTK